MRVRQGASSGTIRRTLRTLASTPTLIKAQVQYHAMDSVLTGDRLPSLFSGGPFGSGPNRIIPPHLAPSIHLLYLHDIRNTRVYSLWEASAHIHAPRKKVFACFCVTLY
ncbi:hypothetical protein Taro_049145 [Colocasia esculenta]|uniref:Uncharacterized protein n=1 Tax=Colocasia esculenta TaxID=4460 RepID=A0A843XA60_COLES|nr:hypothetical protein [Colocasia esculenta]